MSCLKNMDYKKLIFFILFLGATRSILAQDILFVGNSLSYTNDMPTMLELLGRGLETKINTQCICQPNYAIEDHLNDGLVETELKKRNYDYLIFQQGPSSQAYGRESLLHFGKQLVVLAKENEVIPAYLMVWPSKAYYQTFNGVIKNHKDAAETNNTMLIPLGMIWLRLNQEHPAYELYGSDGFHPSKLGSLLEALVILKSIHPDLNLTNLESEVIDDVFSSKKESKAFLETLSKYFSEL